ncbi:MAG: hypothetical protein ABEI75_03215 [Halobaculum sp.]
MTFADAGGPADAYANRAYDRLAEWVSGTSVAEDERRLHLTPQLYPSAVTAVVLGVQHTAVSNTTNVRYSESWGGVEWECRWDREDNPHNDREHFHYPPDPDSNDDPYACDADYRKGVLLIDTPAEFVERRVEHLFITDDPRYPSEYEWANEYQPDRYDCSTDGTS